MVFAHAKRFSHLMVTISACIGAAALATMSIAVTYEVVFRYFFNMPTTWSTETSRYCSVYIFFMGLAYALKEKSHIRVEIVVKRFSSRFRCILNVVTSSVGIVLSLVIAVEGWKMFFEAYEFSLRSMEVLRTPLVIPYFCIPWGGFWLAVEYTIEMLEHAHDLVKGEI